MITVQELTSEPVARIMRWSRVLYWFSTALVVMVPVGIAWTWCHFDELAPFLPSTAGIQFDPSNVTTLIRLGALGLNLIPGLVAMYGFWQLRHLFALFTTCRYFDAEAIRRVRNFALAVVVYSLAAPLARLFISTLISLSNPPGERVLLLRISSDDLVTVFLGGVFFVIAKVWVKIKEIADENAQIV